ncbi:NAD(P)-binding protein [Xylariaceae sp. FL0016]|nr:NAD(P)-binding protein [Xylariaceae sp. FL0016]
MWTHGKVCIKKTSPDYCEKEPNLRLRLQRPKSTSEFLATQYTYASQSGNLLRGYFGSLKMTQFETHGFIKSKKSNAAIAASLTKTYHTVPYASISPTRPELSQAGKTILITGGNGGIGHAIARAFLRAGASCLVILGRRADVTAEAARRLGQEPSGSGCKILGLTCDIGNEAAVADLWEKLRGDGIAVDVLVLNAAMTSIPFQPVMEVGTKAIWTAYNVNLRAQIDMTERFYKQERQDARGAKSLVHVSTAAAHDWTICDAYPGYGLTKNTGALALQVIAQDTSPGSMQIVNFHPGLIFTEAARGHGFKENDMPYNDEDLPGQFAVWAASSEAKFLHGRFVWANWDVDELKKGEIRKRLDEDTHYLKFGVVGL